LKREKTPEISLKRGVSTPGVGRVRHRWFSKETTIAKNKSSYEWWIVVGNVVH
jgi:hypothetical protein